MKLRSGFITQEIDNDRFMVPMNADAFNGIVRSNSTAAFIQDCLKEETTQEAIVEKMCEQYDAPRETIAADVRRILDALRSLHALDEE